jgi:hypothetical protein
MSLPERDRKGRGELALLGAARRWPELLADRCPQAVQPRGPQRADGRRGVGESDAFLDEHPESYKPIDVVMRDAEPLVDVVHELRQIVNVKGN